MSRRYDAAWGSQEREEHDAIVREVLAEAEGNGARAELYRARVDDAIQAHRPWARDVEGRVLQNGYLNFWKSVSREGTVFVVRGKRTFQKPRTWAVTRTDDEGKRYTQDALIDVFTREDVENKRRDSLAMSRTWDDAVRMWAGVLAFMDAAGADDTETAAAVLGVSVNDWLSGEVAA